MTETGREQSIVWVFWVRQVAMYHLRDDTAISLPRIGQHLGGPYHTTILHGCARVSHSLVRDERPRDERGRYSRFPADRRDTRS